MRNMFVKSAPVLTFVGSLLALVLTHAKDIGSPFLSDIEPIEFFEVIWSLLLVAVVVWMLRKNGPSSRTSAWLFGLAGFVGVVTAYVIPLSVLILGASAPDLQTHEQISLALIYLVWALGISWTVRAFVLSVSSGDWGRTVWAKFMKRNSF